MAASMDALADRELIDLVVAGDPAAREEFARRYQRLIKGVIGRMHLAPGASATAGQQVWIKMLADDCRVLRQWKGGDSIGPFLARVVRNCALDVLREFARLPQQAAAGGDDHSPPPVASEELGPLAIIARDEELQSTEDLARDLSPADQDLFWRRLVFEQSPSEIAEAYGIPPNAVYVRLHRLRERLARVLEVRAPALFTRLRKLEGEAGPDKS
jgi:RNA polymerase sigma factor (sigma-70 family)